jgi:glycosyltransferase involved in cell wall biosynthesis
MQVSVAICTCNRSELLKLCLESLARQTHPPDQFEIIVIDNNSTDLTQEVVMNFVKTNRNLTIKLLVETKQGVSFARNRALGEACFPVIAFIDDDETADENWLADLITPFTNPEIHVVGGAVELEFLAPLPNWFFPELCSHLCDYKPTMPELYFLKGTEYLPVSGNLAARRQSMLQVGGFNTFLGRKSDDSEIMGGEETKLLKQMFEAGMTIAIQPTARVLHLVPESKLTKSYFFRIIDGFTKMDLMFLFSKKIMIKLFYLLRYCLGFLVHLPIGLLRILLSTTPSKRFKAQLKMMRKFFKVKQSLKYLLSYYSFNNI